MLVKMKQLKLSPRCKRQWSLKVCCENGPRLPSLPPPTTGPSARCWLCSSPWLPSPSTCYTSHGSTPTCCMCIRIQGSSMCPTSNSTSMILQVCFKLLRSVFWYIFLLTFEFLLSYFLTSTEKNPILWDHFIDRLSVDVGLLFFSRTIKSINLDNIPRYKVWTYNIPTKI